MVNMTDDAQSLAEQCGTSVHATEALLCNLQEQKIKQLPLPLSAPLGSGGGYTAPSRFKTLFGLPWGVTSNRLNGKDYCHVSSRLPSPGHPGGLGTGPASAPLRTACRAWRATAQRAGSSLSVHCPPPPNRTKRSNRSNSSGSPLTARRRLTGATAQRRVRPFRIDPETV